VATACSKSALPEYSGSLPGWTCPFSAARGRFCLDARKLNALTIKDAYHLPSIEGILSRIDQTHYISSVDLKFAFWQIELDERSK